MGGIVLFYGLPGIIDDGAWWWGWLGINPVWLPWVVVVVAVGILISSGVAVLRQQPQIVPTESTRTLVVDDELVSPQVQDFARARSAILEDDAAQEPDVSALERKNTEIKLIEIANRQEARTKCGELLERGYKLKARLHGHDVVLFALLPHGPITVWVYDVRGFALGQLRFFPDDFPDDEETDQTLNNGGLDDVRALVARHLDLLGKVMKRIPPA